MQDLFKGYYQPTPEQFRKMWEEGTFVFDTNVLLSLYRYKEESKDEILNVIKKLEGRIWIPYQVALEFHNGRLAVLNTQNKDLSAIKSSIRQSINSIEKKCKDLNLDERHSEVETSAFMGRFKKLSDSVIKELDEIKPKKLTNDIEDDSILTEISSLFNSEDNTLGLSPKDQDTLDKIYKEGEFRAKNRIPPSFEDILKADKNKGDEKFYAFEGLYYKKGYGDLIIWKQIIEFAKDNMKENIVFVTNDSKEDWMRAIGLDSNSVNKQIVSARPELVSEIFKEASVKNFYIYDTESFLDSSRIYLETNVQEDTLSDIKSKLIDTNNLMSSYFKELVVMGETAVNVSRKNDLDIIEEWLDERYMFILDENPNKLFDFTVVLPDGVVVPVLVRFIVWINDEAISDLLSNISIFDNYGKYHIILIVSNFNSSKADVIHKSIFEYFNKFKNDPVHLEKTKVIVTVANVLYEDRTLENLIEYEF